MSAYEPWELVPCRWCAIAIAWVPVRGRLVPFECDEGGGLLWHRGHLRWCPGPPAEAAP